eukprot:CAMPEP_0206538268 /NCGR_PEP_ID=MMETSP0325_2-20121206/7768_1 /ASSEMBLY_ACC=CAM_ASM_000347 /TAXON_ID=2866 /ORGANISM="Crypthecodinium cohnii, Strain Seligo" /LENGTH=133 /DNA_ID=CAMNT_0054035687 /DNA_START=451 /DNA_END=849 /DNA_ORIENTATION=-
MGGAFSNVGEDPDDAQASIISSVIFGSKPKTAAELRDEKYCGFLIGLDKVLEEWKKGKLRNQEALMHADYYMEKIQEVGRVDASRAKEILASKGVDDKRRLFLQQAYQELKKACGQRVPQFDDNGMHRQDSHW